MIDYSADPLWKPSDKLYYYKYTCKITLGPFPNTTTNVVAESPHRSRCSFIFNRDTKKYDLHSTIYTSDEELLKALYDTWPYNEICTPINEEHKKLMEESIKTKVVIREKKWFNKFKYKINMWQPFLMARQNRHPPEQTVVVTNWINDMFDDTRIGINQYYSTSYNIYTNDYKTLMLLKLTWGSDYQIDISEVVTFDEIKQKA